MPNVLSPTRRHAVVLLACVALLSCGVLHAALAEARTQFATSTSAPTGQTTVSGLLPASATDFASAADGWGPFHATVGWTSAAGHSSSGALAVAFAGPWTGAASPSFDVVPGDRYSASGWMRAASTGHNVGLALRFYDSTGAVLDAGTQIGQWAFDSTSAWTQSLPVVGFAPAGAVTANVIFLGYDTPAGEQHYLDDLSVSQTSGVAAPVAGPLTTHGAAILDRNGRQVVLRGIHTDGPERPALTAVPVTSAEIAAAHQWGANLIRLPLAENPVVPGDCAYDPGYLDEIDGVVRTITEAGMVALLDLHTNALTPCGATVQQPMPDAEAVTFWQAVAARYKDNPLVAFDLYNEPHDVSDKVWRNGGQVTGRGGVVYDATGMQRLYDTIRSTGADNLVFASGTNWANDYPAGAPLTGTRNLVYAAHAYTCPTGTPSSGHQCNPGPGGIYDPSGILADFAAVASTLPVMLTEFGWPDKYDGTYLRNTIDYSESHGFVGWDVFAFDGSNTGLFDLVKNTGPLNDPAQTGMAVLTGLARN